MILQFRDLWWRSLLHLLLLMHGAFVRNNASLQQWQVSVKWKSSGWDLGQLVPDGDWRSVATPVNATDEQINALSSTVFQNPNLVQSMLLCIAATKANWWSMCHHTGQGTMVGYALKVAKCLHVRMQLMHLIGNWCSTIYILTRAGVEGLRETLPPWGNEPAHPITFTEQRYRDLLQYKYTVCFLCLKVRIFTYYQSFCYVPRKTIIFKVTFCKNTRVFFTVHIIKLW